jgi:hypothetical protein
MTLIPSLSPRLGMDDTDGIVISKAIIAFSEYCKSNRIPFNVVQKKDPK